MKALFSFLCLSFLMGQISCRSLNGHLVLSRFTINGKMHNRFIEDRVPQYGDGNLDGCIVERQIALSLRLVKGESIIGEIKDSRTLELLSHASLKVIFKGQTPVIVHTDTAGKFKVPKHSHSELEKLEVYYIGYRTLEVDLSKKKTLL